MKQDIIPSDQKNLELTAQAFYLARERKQSLSYLKKASKTATESKFFLNYGQRLLAEEEWKTAEKIFKKALQTQDIKETLEQIENYKESLKNKDISAFNESNIYPNELSIEKQKNIQAEKATDNSENKESNLKEITNDYKITDTSKNKKSNSEEKIGKQEKAPPTNYLEHIYLGIGIALYNQKKYEEALIYFKKSIEVKDTFLTGYQWIDYTETSLKEEKQPLQKTQ